MSRRRVIALLALCLLTVGCRQLAESWQDNQPFSAVAHYEALSGPQAGQLKDLTDDSVTAYTAWTQAEPALADARYAQASVMPVYAQGAIELLLSGPLLRGTAALRLPGEALLQEEAAFALYGSSDVVGLPLWIGGAEYRIAGVFRVQQGIWRWGAQEDLPLVLLPFSGGITVQSVGLCLASSALETAQCAGQALAPLGTPDRLSVSAHKGWWVSWIKALPQWIWALAMLCHWWRGFLRLRPPWREEGRRRLPRMLAMAGSLAALSLCCLLLDRPFAFPMEWLPTSWSDFAHWQGLWQQAGAALFAEPAAAGALFHGQSVRLFLACICFLFFLLICPCLFMWGGRKHGKHQLIHSTAAKIKRPRILAFIKTIFY